MTGSFRAAIVCALAAVAAGNDLPDNGQYYGYLDVASLLGAAALNPHDPYFAKMRPEAIKAAHGHFQHVAEADPGDDFPYAEFRKYEAAGFAEEKPPLLVTATFRGKKRPVYFSWSLELDQSGRPTAKRAQWAQAVNLRDDRYVRFFIDPYVRKTLWRPQYENYWVMVDNCAFRYELYGVLDDDGVFRPGVAWDVPFAATEHEFVESVIYFLRRLKELAPDIRIMGNEGSLDDESDYVRIWQGFDGSVREDINAGFATDAGSRKEILKFYRRYEFLAGAGKVAILRALLPAPGTKDFEEKMRTSYVTYLIFHGDHFFYGPRLDDGTARGIAPAAYAEMRERLGVPAGPPQDRAFGIVHDYFRLYSRECEGGTVFLNYTGKPQRIDLYGTSVTIPDGQGSYILKRPEGERASCCRAKSVSR